MAVNPTAQVEGAPGAGGGRAPGDVIDVVGMGPDGFGISASMVHAGNGEAKGKIDPLHIQRAITQALGDKPGIESLSKDIMKVDAKIHAPASQRRGLQAMKSQQAGGPAAAKPKATDSFSNNLFGKTPEQIADTKKRIEEILALQHREIKINVVHLNPKTEAAQDIVDGVKAASALTPTTQTSQKAAATTGKPRNWAGLESHRPSPWTA